MHGGPGEQAAILTCLLVMKPKWNMVIVFTLVLAVGAALYGAYLSVRLTEKSIPSLFPTATGSRLLMSMEGFRFIQSENGRVSWRVYAQGADLYESKEAQLRDLEITFIASDRKEAALLGESGTMDTVTGNASVRKVSREVKIVTSDGYLLTTSSLFWKAGQRQVSTPDPFKLLGSEIYLEGRGISADVDMRTIAVNGNVKAVLQE
jgi:LPS export ABC transporter protein LptC